MSHQAAHNGVRRFEKRMTAESVLAKTSRFAQLNPPIDLRTLDYVSTYDANLMCPICRCPFVDPVVLAECDHCFCRDCIRQCWTTNGYTPLGPRGDCPTCRTPGKLGPRTAMSKILSNILEELVVKCPKEEDGCPAEMKRGEVQDHVRIYCGYAFVECSAEDCDLPVRRKDFAEGDCQHCAVSCIDCRRDMKKSDLESHWRSECPDRSVKCDLCKDEVPYRSLSRHREEACPATCICCPGRDLGCGHSSRKAIAEAHAKECMFAKLAPAMKAQKDRLDAHESAQKEVVRKLGILQTGFERMKDILADSRQTTPSASYEDGVLSSTDSSSELPYHQDLTILPESFSFPAGNDEGTLTSPPARPAPPPPGPELSDDPAYAAFDFDLASPFPPPTTNGGPYASPLHHLLSMHESLRDEMSRMNTALQELEGRHSMQILNENLRTREETSYLGAQVAGLSRQVHWLTSTQLQRQQHRAPTPQAGGPSGSGGGLVSDLAGAGVGVEAAVQSAANALRGVTRRASQGEGVGAVRRQRSEEGRTKL
ncbi:hypothetical protein K431DRAFT_235586 [Polychaeton citri CBS 116435]|uniref:RING-type domain-containing protein n=1 Tax=Polychaeton citri CBS 116435 TaxID=1314669 RepID=A0A9P4Q0P4_9PEZI|nr:hypothetical protein K431DRAFT_235586 [Polychaeton citri CBS 116435]